MIVAGTRDAGHDAGRARGRGSDVRPTRGAGAARRRHGAAPPAFEMLYEVTGYGRTNLDAMLVHTAKLNYQADLGRQLPAAEATEHSPRVEPAAAHLGEHAAHAAAAVASRSCRRRRRRAGRALRASPLRRGRASASAAATARSPGRRGRAARACCPRTTASCSKLRSIDLARLGLEPREHADGARPASAIALVHSAAKRVPTDSSTFV